MIRINPRLAEHGKIKIGKLGEERTTRDGKGKYRLPTKLDHFIITTTERDNTGNFTPNVPLMRNVGALVNEPPARLTKIPIYLLFDDMDSNFYTTFNCYRGKTLICQGDGETAVKTETGEEVKCPCPLLDKDYEGKTPCKPYGRLSVIIQDMDIVGSVWVYRTTGWNSVQDLLGSLLLVKRIAGRMSGIPLILKLMPKTVQLKRGPATIYTASIIYEGSIPALAEAARNLPMIGHDESMMPDQAISEAEEIEIAEEFYPPKEEEISVTSKTETSQGKTKGVPTAADLAKELETKSKKALEGYLEELAELEYEESVDNWEKAEKRSSQLNLEDSMELKKAIADCKKALRGNPAENKEKEPPQGSTETTKETEETATTEEKNYEKLSTEIKALTLPAEFDEWASTNRETLPNLVTAKQKKALLSIWTRLKNKAQKLEKKGSDQKQELDESPPAVDKSSLTEDHGPAEDPGFDWV